MESSKLKLSLSVRQQGCWSGLDAEDLHAGPEADGDPVRLGARPLQLVHLGPRLVRQDRICAPAAHAEQGTRHQRLQGQGPCGALARRCARCRCRHSRHPTRRPRDTRAACHAWQIGRRGRCTPGDGRTRGREPARSSEERRRNRAGGARRGNGRERGGFTFDGARQGLQVPDERLPNPDTAEHSAARDMPASSPTPLQADPPLPPS